MSREKVFLLLRIILWFSTIMALVSIGITSFFFITKDPVPYLDTSSACSMGQTATATTSGCSDPQGPAKQAIYAGAKIALGAAMVIAVITSTALIIYGAEHNHTLENRAARGRNRIAMISAAVAIVIAVVIIAIFENISMRF